MAKKKTTEPVVDEVPSSPTEQTPAPTKNKTLHWSPTDEIKITGLQFDVLQKFAAAFEPLIVLKNSIWNTMIEQGLVKDETETVITFKDLKN